MKILAIDTSGNTARWIGIDGDLFVDPVHIRQIRKHDLVLADGISNWIRLNDWKKLDAVAVVTGPGSYTGLRVGVAFATAYAMSLNIPVIPISAFELHASRPESGICWVLLPMRKNTCRGQLMQAGIPPEEISKPHEVNIQDFIPPTDQRVMPIGDGYDKYQARFDEKLGSRRIIELSAKSPEYALAELVKLKYHKNEFFPAQNIDVYYGEDFKPTRKSN